MPCKYFAKIRVLGYSKYQNFLSKLLEQNMTYIIAIEKTPSMLLEVLSFTQCLILKTPQFLCYEQHDGRD
jgi:hypothetical protein